MSDLTPVAVPDGATAELLAFSGEAERLVAGLPGPGDMTVAAARAQNAAQASPRLDRARDEVVSALGRSVGVRVIDRPHPVGVYLHIHGGGWTMGGADLQDERLEALSLATGFTVVSVAYRLAPEHPHPAGADDCETAACWLAAAGRTVFGTERFVIGGESAGAHLSAVTLLRLRDRHGTVGAFAGACLAYGMYDLGMSPSALQRGPRRIVLSTPIIDYHRRCLLGGAVDPTDPDVSPIQASLHGLPPALLSVGTDDPLVDDSVFFWARWRLAGSPARIDLYEGGFHAFDLFPGRVAEVCTARQWAFLTACATGDGDPLGTVATRR